MEAWEDFSAFEGVFELEHVCELLSEQASLDPALRDAAKYLTGEDSHLIKRLNLQAAKSEKIIETEKPGLYRRTWIAHLFGEMFGRLDELTGHPEDLQDAMPWLREALHKVLIAAHDVFDPHHRAALVSKALLDGEAKGVASAKEERRRQSREAVKARPDQAKKARFMIWGEAAVAAGKKADTVEDLQSLEGFESSWSQVTEKTLKAWAREAGFVFKTGRPKTKK